jgi:hypothetical protein
MRSTGRIDPAVRDFVSYCQVKPEDEEQRKGGEELLTEESKKWLNISSEWEGAKVLLDVVSSEELRTVSSAWYSVRIRIVGMARGGEIEHYAAAKQELIQSSSQLYAAIRKELSLEDTSASP